MICAVVANAYRDPDKKPEPFTVADFMPGARTEEDEMREFVERVQRGDTFEVDPAEAAAFRRQMTMTFRNVRAAGEPDPPAEAPTVTTIGPAGRAQLNAIAGETPRRGVR